MTIADLLAPGLSGTLRSLAHRRLSLALALALVPAGTALATVDEGAIEDSFLETQTLGRGLDPAKSFAFGELDSVNVFNGNLTFSIPLGQAYPAAGAYSYGLRLVYNSSAWDFEAILIEEDDPGESCPGTPYSVALPMRDANAGLGWKVEIGSLYPPRRPRAGWSGLEPNENPNASLNSWLAIAPDGSKRQFIEAIHPASPPDHQGGLEVFYSDDGSFARLRVQRSEDWAVLDLPDGTSLVFENYDPAAYNGAGAWRLRRVFDLTDAPNLAAIPGVAACPASGAPEADGKLFVDYAGDSGDETWTLCDNTGRRHYLRFGGGGSWYPRLLTEVDLAGIGGRLVWKPVYTFAAVSRPEGHTANAARPDLFPLEVAVPLLTELRQPSASADGQDTRRSFTFEYFTSATPQSGEIGPGLQLPRDAGYLARAVLPTRGSHEYTYQLYLFPEESACAGTIGNRCAKNQAQQSERAGIRSRRLVDPFSQLPELAGAAAGTRRDTWVYSFWNEPRQSFGNCVSWGGESQRIVIDPEGHATVSYFNVYTYLPFTSATEEEYEVTEYGLPYTKKKWTPAGDGTPLYLSSALYPDCAADLLAGAAPTSGHPYLAYVPDGAGLALPEARCAAKLLRAEFARYEHLTAPAPGEWPDWCLASPTTCKAFRLQTASATLHFDDPLGSPSGFGTSRIEGYRFRRTLLGDADGLGRFRRERREGFAATGTGVEWQESYDAWTASTATVTATQPPAGYPSPLESWFLGARDYRTVWDATAARRSDFLFDEERGLLLARRTRVATSGSSAAGPPLGAADRIVAFDYDAEGEVVSTRVFGGALAPLPTTEPFAEPGAAASYRKDVTYAHGAPEDVAIVDDATGTVLLSLLDRTIEAETGAVLAERGPDGLTTSAAYDRLLRPVRVDRPGLSPVTISYVEATASSAALAKVVESAPGETVAKTESHEVSGLGRPYRTWSTVPQGSDPDTDHRVRVARTFRADGRTASESVPTRSGQTVPGFTAYFYDALGRITLRREPDFLPGASGPRNERVFLYLGDRRTTERHRFNTARDTVAFAWAEKVSFHDFRGRLRKVRESSSGDGTATFDTDYQYDVAGHLTQVRMGSQLRSFRSDGLGQLVAETHPEIGEEHAHHYDALGRRVETKSASGAHWLEYGYDRLGRPAWVWDRAAIDPDNPDGRMLQEWFYAYGNAPGDSRAGKEVMARRHNWVPADPAAPLGGATLEHLAVAEIVRYDEANGLPASKWTRISDGHLFEQAWDYDGHGNVAAESYPDCQAPAACAGALPARAATYSYEAGTLMSVAADVRASGSLAERAIAAIRYHASGVPATVSQGDGSVWNQAADPAGLPRPKSISVTKGASALFATGDYLYDGMGSPIAIGEQRFRYDKVGRLQEALLAMPSNPAPTVPAGPAFDQAFDYDATGNLVQVVTNGRAQPWPTVGTTNRLSGFAYDARGNQTTLPAGLEARYDALNAMTALRGTGVNSTYLYTAAGERVRERRELERIDRWTLRGAGAQLLRTAREDLDRARWSLETDAIHGSRPLAFVEPGDGIDETVRHVHTDHLGSIRLETTASGEVVRHDYAPYGAELTATASPTPLRFTGHEADPHAPDTPGAAHQDDLTYMHARYYSLGSGRFQSVDPMPGSPETPQSWSRFAYVRGNPLALVDPDGRLDCPALLGLGCWAASKVARSIWNSNYSGQEFRDSGAQSTIYAVSTGLATVYAALKTPPVISGAVVVVGGVQTLDGLNSPDLKVLEDRLGLGGSSDKLSSWMTLFKNQRVQVGMRALGEISDERIRTYYDLKLAEHAAASDPNNEELASEVDRLTKKFVGLERMGRYLVNSYERVESRPSYSRDARE